MSKEAPNHIYNDLNLNMSLDRYHSLPKKTQPTLATANRMTTTAERQPLATEPAVCPEVSDFKMPKFILPKEQLYIHNLHIDYGRLAKPYYYEE